MIEAAGEGVRVTHRNSALDVVRALAAFIVLIHHARNLFFVDDQIGVGLLGKFFYFATNFGPDAVMVFFILSGYLVGGSVMRQMELDCWSWPRYLVTRLSRLWVVLLPALVITAVLDHTGLAFFHTAFYEGNEGNRILRTPVANALTLPVFACNALFLQTLICHTFGSDSPLWSLANEFWYYLWFPPIFAIIYRRYRKKNWVALMLVLVTMFLFPSIILGFGLWLLGALGAALQGKNHVKFRAITIKAEWPALGIFVAILFASKFFRLSAEVVGLAFFPYFLCLLTKKQRSSDGLVKHLAFLIAEQSYTLYLVHMPFILLMVSATAGARSPLRAISFLLYCGLILLTYMLALIFYMIFERNTVHVKNLLICIMQRHNM